ncbi:MAG: DsrE family protein [Gammaproteobacteria bacterium]
MRPKISFILFSLFTLTLISFSSSAASYLDQVSRIISESEAPEGVVFEIVTGEPEGLRWALPEAKKEIERLRAKFPDLDIAVVTHGREQFALQKKHKQRYRKVHSLTESLVKDSGVSLHVCGTYAEWHNVAADEFAEYADVAAAGPAQINDYVKLGYIKILIERDD